MKILRRIIYIDNDEDDCIYQLVHNECAGYYWNYIGRSHWFDETIGEYSILRFGDERNLNGDHSKDELAGLLRFEPADLEVNNEHCA